MGLPRLAPVAGVIALGVGLALLWAVRLPLLQGPDEIAHLDYAMYLADVGAPFRVTHAAQATRATPEIRYLARAIGYQRLRYNPYARVAPGYGSAAAWRALDAAAPDGSGLRPHAGATLPYVMFAYPIGYYVVIAAVLYAARSLTHSLSVACFAARFANVASLAATLAFAYATFRRARLERTTALLALLAVATFPLVSMTLGYVQPDDLALLLVTVALWAAVAGEARPRASRTVVLCVALAGLAMTKQQYALAVWLPALALRAGALARTRTTRDLVASAALACVPAAALALSLVLTPIPHHGGLAGLLTHGNTATAATAPHAGPHDAHAAAPEAAPNGAALVAQAAAETYAGGTAFASYWFHFGVRGATIYPATAIAVLSPALVGLTLATIVVVAAVQFAVARRLARVARRGRRRAFSRLVGSAPWVGVYVVLTAEIFAIYALTRGGFALQGRYWVPVLVPLVLIVLVQLPKVARAGRRAAIARTVAAAYAAYALVAALFAARALDAHFYAPAGEAPQRDTVAAIERARDADGRALDLATLRVDGPIELSGYAIDMRTGLPPTGLVLTVDGIPRPARVRVGLARADVAEIFHDDGVRDAGFAVRLDPARLAVGPHALRLAIAGATDLPFRDGLDFVVARGGAAARSPQSFRP